MPDCPLAQPRRTATHPMVLESRRLELFAPTLRSRAETNDRSAAPLKDGVDRENPSPTSRVRVRYISVVHAATGSQAPKPNDQAIPRSHKTALPSSKIQMAGCKCEPGPSAGFGHAVEDRPPRTDLLETVAYTNLR